MLEAARLMRFTDLTVQEVGHRTGFRDPLYFSRAFKRHHGEPPQAYRARVQGKSPCISDGLPFARRRPFPILLWHMSTTTTPDDAATTRARLAPTTRLGAVELTVTDLDRSVAFYQDAIGLRLHRRDDPVAAMGAGGEDLMVLVEEQTAGRAGRHAGLYHLPLVG